MTKEEFEKQYAENSGVTVERLHELGRYAVPCDCGDESCREWQMAHTTDLEKFVALYKEFGIECKVNPRDEGGSEIILQEDDYMADESCTTSDKFDGYNGFFTRIEFDAEGKFVKQGFWE